MEYFSGISGVSLTFVVMMTMCSLSIFLLLIGLYFNLRKWSQGSEGYGLDPVDGKKGNILVFFKSYWNQLNAHSVHHGQIFFETLIFDVLLQRRTLRADPFRWFMHILIFVGWMGLFALSGLMFFIEITHMVGIEIMDPGHFRDLLQFPNQVLGYILLFGVLIALVRRLVIPKVRQNTNSYDAVLIVTLFVVVVSGFIAHAGRYIATGITDFTGIDLLFLDYKIWTLWGMPVFLTYVKELALAHSVLALFIGFSIIAFSKYIHMITSPLTMILNKGGEK